MAGLDKDIRRKGKAISNLHSPNWGQPGDELLEAPMDHFDPSYDSTEERFVCLVRVSLNRRLLTHSPAGHGMTLAKGTFARASSLRPTEESDLGLGTLRRKELSSMRRPASEQTGMARRLVSASPCSKEQIIRKKLSEGIGEPPIQLMSTHGSEFLPAGIKARMQRREA